VSCSASAPMVSAFQLRLGSAFVQSSLIVQGGGYNKCKCSLTE